MVSISLALTLPLDPRVAAGCCCAGGVTGRRIELCRLPSRNLSSRLFLLPLRQRSSGLRAVPLLPPWRGVRASAGATAGLRQVETDRLPSDLRDRAMDAVDHFGGRVTVGDVAGRAGLRLAEAERALQAIAADTGGFLEVSEEGEVLYVFPRDYRSKLLSRSFRMKLEPVLAKSKDIVAYLIRVSFGTALIASIVLVYTTIIAILSSSSEEDNRGRRRIRSYDNFVIIPSDIFWYWDSNYYRRRQREAAGGTNFIESVFSFVFGDGDPNEGLEEERWKMVGQYISSRGGVVTAEELAPYLDLLPDQSSDDENFVLPVLLRFQGHPEVDEQGNILYRFPSLQITGTLQRAVTREYVGYNFSQVINGIDKYLKEKAWQFSKTSASERAMVAGLGGLNLFGVIILGSLLNDISVAPRGLISFAAQIFPFLQVYATAFFVIPLVRWLLLQKRNVDIAKRNEARKQRAKVLELPEPSLRRKLLSARDMARKKVISQDEVIYTTEKDMLDQDYETREWDRRFRERDSN